MKNHNKMRSLLVMPLGLAVAAVATWPTMGCSTVSSPAADTASLAMTGEESLSSASDSTTSESALAATYDSAFECRTDTIGLNGVSLLYEVKGQGKPVILLHGNGGSHADLDSAMNVLSRSGYKVFGIDSRGQGANPPLQEYHYADMAEDLYQFIVLKNLGNPAVYGWSDGGNTALQMEVLHPGTCALIITSGANIFPDGWGGHQNIVKRIQNDPNPKPLRKMLYYEPTMTWHDMTTITCPVLVTAGQNDVILESHSRTIADSIPNAEFLMVKGANHTSYVKHSARIASIILSFLQKNNY